MTMIVLRSFWLQVVILGKCIIYVVSYNMDVNGHAICKIKIKITLFHKAFCMMKGQHDSV